jgi:geranylgeranyl diphosphate synthase type II
LELIHAYSLIHDDLPAMDDAATRRGRPSCHARFGEAVAILAGDALQTLAFEVLAGGIEGIEAREAAVTLRVARLIAEAAGPAGMAGGQAIDIAWSNEHVTEVKDSQLLRMHSMKTGALIRVACEAGAVLGGGTDEQVAALRRYGEHLGSAFQIHDDVLDVEGDPHLTGKHSTDVANDKTTAPAVFGLEEAKRLAGSASDRALSALSTFGGEAEALRQLAHFVVRRAK